MILGTDYSTFSYAGERFPSRRSFHNVSKWCAKEPDDHSSHTVTPSSTDEVVLRLILSVSVESSKRSSIPFVFTVCSFKACGRDFVCYPREWPMKSCPTVHVRDIITSAQTSSSESQLRPPSPAARRTRRLAQFHLDVWLLKTSYRPSHSQMLRRHRLIDLEPAFEHLLRDVGVEESTILALRHCRINDRETFTGLADSAEELRSISGINLKDGRGCHTRESSPRF